MSLKPLVSVSMITYNHEKYIEEAILGVLRQETEFDIELIVSNDDSPDDTDKIIRRIIKEHPKAFCIRYIKHNENIGAMPNSLHNLKLFTGRYIALCEGDDCWTDSKKLQIQIEAMQKRPNCDISFHAAEILSASTRTNRVVAFHYFTTKIFSARDIIMGGGEFCPTASIVIKRSIVEDAHDFLQQAPVGDYFLQVMGSLKGGSLYLNRVMSAYRRDTPFSWTAEMQCLQKKKVFFNQLLSTIQRFDRYLKGAHTSALNFEIERHYIHLSLTYLGRGCMSDYRSFFQEYSRKHCCSFRVKALFHTGILTQSVGLVVFLDRLFFGYPFPWTRVLRKLFSYSCNCRMRQRIEPHEADDAAPCEVLQTTSSSR